MSTHEIAEDEWRVLGGLYERGPAHAADAAEAVAAALGRMHAGAPGAPPSPVGPGAQTYGRVLGGCGLL